MNMKVVLITGGFDPCHSGHVAYIRAAKQLGDHLVVGLNSDVWLQRKKGQAFMSWNERKAIVQHIDGVDEVISFDDSEGHAADAIKQVLKKFPDSEVIFANGGDRNQYNVIEQQLVDWATNLTFEFGVGGTDKRNSSSAILANWKYPRTMRTWGWYEVLYETKTHKIKRLCCFPKHSLSLQRHAYRSEYWQIESGTAGVELDSAESILQVNQSITIPQGSWHRLYNETDEPCYIIEIQYGEQCVETDIERMTTNG